MLIGVAGANGAGKGEVIRMLEERGFESLSLSDAIRDVLKERGLEESRERMIETGRELRREGGPGVLALRLLAMMDPDRDYAIDSVRHPAEVETLREQGEGFRLLWVEADEAIRFERIRARARSGDPETIEELRELEGRETGSSDPAAQQLHAVRDLADATIVNDGGLEQLHDALDAVLG